MRINQTFAGLGISIFVALAATSARADTVDGTWCFSDARSFSISGPQIITPGKHTVIGIYGRHSFSYVVPDGETDSGQTVEMRLLNEETIQVKVGSHDTETWRRCQVISWSSAPDRIGVS